MSDPDPWSRDRWWNTALQQWVYPHDMNDALDAATLAIDEYYNGDRAWAEQWLLRAYEANQEKPIRTVAWSASQDPTSWDISPNTGSHDFTEANQEKPK